MKTAIVLTRGVGLFVYAMVACLTTHAQNNRDFVPNDTNIFSDKTTPGFFYLRNDVNISAERVLVAYKNSLGLGSSDEMKPIKTIRDEVGFTHIKHQQLYNGLPVEGSMLTVHANRSGRVYLINGQVIRNLRLPTTPVVSEAAALETALQKVPARKYVWQHPAFESLKKRAEKDTNATYYPKGVLCIYPTTRNEQMLTEGFSLGWRFDIYVQDGNSSTRVFVDAIDGQVKNTYKIGKECDPATASTTFNGTRTIYTKLNGYRYNLHNDCQATVIHTYNLTGDSVKSNATEFEDLNTDWNLPSQTSQTQTHFSTEQVYNYYKNNHNRFSWNNANGEMSSYHGVRGIAYANACWGCLGDVAQFGIGPTVSANDDWNSLDIVGHEFTHGVFQTEVGFDYYAQIGALNESFADIFGERVETTTEGSSDATSAWLVGEDRGAIRSFLNPNAGNQPDTYKGTWWFNTDTCVGQPSGDNCGVHTNSGVQNYWYYLLSVGGSATNDNGEPFSVAAIGSTKAARIAYRNLQLYIAPGSGFLGARNGAIQAAEDLYGVCSNEAVQTAKAWFAVGADVEHTFYNRVLNCVSFSSNSTTLWSEGIRSITLKSNCGLANMTSTNYPIYISAGKFATIQKDVVLKATGSSPIIVSTNDCSFTVF